jgi:hypothetical protein
MFVRERSRGRVASKNNAETQRVFNFMVWLTNFLAFDVLLMSSAAS